jgi:hypothetical protein
MKTAFALAVASMFLVIATAMTAFAASQTNQISFRYVPPKNPAHRTVYKGLKERRVFEKLQKLLSPFRLPRKLKFLVAGCDGEDDASYGDDTITICYEYVDKLFKNMPAKTTAAGIAPIDTVIGPFFDTCLHEFAHALFDMLEVPVLGREEDAADQVAAYISLLLGKVEARRVITGAARGHFIAADSDDAAETRKEFDEDFAETHSTPKQRAYNMLCIAYGADTKLFGDFVSKGYLPKSRAETCEEEYEKVQDAVETLIRPHIDRALAKKVLSHSWFRKLPKRQRQGQGQRRRSSRRRR